MLQGPSQVGMHTINERNWWEMGNNHSKTSTPTETRKGIIIFKINHFLSISFNKYAFKTKIVVFLNLVTKSLNSLDILKIYHVEKTKEILSDQP